MYLTHDCLFLVGYISGKNQSGWKQFPWRIMGWFNQRNISREVGEQALAIALDHKAPMKALHVQLDSDSVKTANVWQSHQLDAYKEVQL